MTGNVGSDKTEIVVADSGRIIFGTCSCAFFQENLLGKGPCEHMIALFKASADGRQDLPTSVPSSAAPASRRLTDDEDEDENEEIEPDEEDFDEDDSDENNEGR